MAGPLPVSSFKLESYEVDGVTCLAVKGSTGNHDSSGADIRGDASRCGPNEKLASNIYSVCTAGKTKTDRHDASGADTKRKATQCRLSEKVVNGTCVTRTAVKMAVSSFAFRGRTQNLLKMSKMSGASSHDCNLCLELRVRVELDCALEVVKACECFSERGRRLGAGDGPVEFSTRPEPGLSPTKPKKSDTRHALLPASLPPFALLFAVALPPLPLAGAVPPGCWPGGTRCEPLLAAAPLGFAVVPRFAGPPPVRSSFGFGFGRGERRQVWRVREDKKWDPGPPHPGVSAAALYYLRHLRSCSATASGCNSGSGSSRGCVRVGPGGLSRWCPRLVSKLLDVAYALVAPACDLLLRGLVAAASPGFWLRALGHTTAVAFLSQLAGESVSGGCLVAVISGCPVPCLAARALLLETGWRSWVGAAGLSLWGVGFHCPGVFPCRLLSLAVAGVNFHDLGWGTFLTCEAVWHEPGYPGGEPAGEANPGNRQAAQRSGLRVTKWFVESKANRQSCCCTACKSNIEQRSLRVRSAGNTRNSKWYHPACVEGGLGPFSEVEGAGSLEPADQDTLRAFCDQPGGVTRAEYVSDVRHAKRLRTEGLDPGAEGGHPLLDPDSGEAAELPEEWEEQRASSQELRNLAWWDGVSYDSLADSVPTVGTVPKDLLHNLGLLRGAVCAELRTAWRSQDLQALSRAEKLLTFLDRLVLHSPRSTGRKQGGLSKVISARLRLAWAGDWGALWREASGAAATLPPPGVRRQQTLREEARSIEAFLKDSLVGRAVGRVCRVAALAVGAVAYEALGPLFPPGQVPAQPQGLVPLAPELREKLLAEAFKVLKRWPARASPGQNGSRFEHWGAVTLDSESWEAAAQVVVMFALGECSGEFLRANLGARVFALRKPNGKLRPVACGSVLRRLAARAACAAFREDIRQACGTMLQYAVGRRAGCEQVHKAIAALTCAAPQSVVLKFDCSNAFNTMPRQLILDAVVARAPGLAWIVCKWLVHPTTHLFWGEGRKGLPLVATSGVDQGCPLSPALFAIALAAPLQRVLDQLQILSPTCRVFSYLDDIYAVVPCEVAERAAAAVVAELQGCGLTVNADKTSVWTADPRAPLPQSLQGLRVDRCQVLGATALWLDRDDNMSRAGVHSLAEGPEVVQSAKAFVGRLVELRKHGLSARAAFWLLQAFSQGHVTHLLRANFEQGSWPREFDDALVEGVQAIVGSPLDASRRAQVFMRLADGGLGFSSAEQAATAAFLGSWALCLHGVAECLGVASWASFGSRCGPLAQKLAEAEAKLIHDSGGSVQPVDWVGLLDEPRGKLQSFWFAKLREHRKKVLLQGLPQDDVVDVRSAGGPGAGGFLEPPVLFEEERPKPMPDKHFITALKDRLRLDVCPVGSVCQHRKEDGTLCGAPLDGRGRHAKKCCVGPTREARHNGLRDFTTSFHPKVTGYAAASEQRVVAWDRVNPRTGLLEEARLDVCTRDSASGRTVYVDTMVTCAHSGYAPRQQARAGRDGVAAADGVRSKRRRYPPHGGELVPLVFEAAGRPAEETVAWVRSWGLELDDVDRSKVIRYAWQQYSTVLQSGNAEMILSAVG